MTCDRFRPSSLMRSIGSVDALGVVAFFVVAGAGWPLRAAVAACWACSARTGTRHATLTRTVVLSSRRMVAVLRDGARFKRPSSRGCTARGHVPSGEEPRVEAIIVGCRRESFTPSNGTPRKMMLGFPGRAPDRSIARGAPPCRAPRPVRIHAQTPPLLEQKRQIARARPEIGLEATGIEPDNTATAPDEPAPTRRPGGIESR